MYTNEYITCLDFDKNYFYKNKQFPCDRLYIVFNEQFIFQGLIKDYAKTVFLQITLTKVLFL